MRSGSGDYTHSCCMQLDVTLGGVGSITCIPPTYHAGLAAKLLIRHASSFVISRILPSSCSSLCCSRALPNWYSLGILHSCLAASKWPDRSMRRKEGPLELVVPLSGDEHHVCICTGLYRAESGGFRSGRVISHVCCISSQPYNDV